MAKSKKNAASASEATAGAKTPEELRAEAEAKSAEVAERTAAFAAAVTAFRRAADMADAVAGGRLGKADGVEAVETALAEAQEGWDQAIALMPDDEPAEETA